MKPTIIAMGICALVLMLSGCTDPMSATAVISNFAPTLLSPDLLGFPQHNYPATYK